MSLLSNIWNRTIGRIITPSPARDPHSYYIPYTFLENAVSAMPNPMNIVSGHEETAYKWYKMSQWVGRTVTPTNSELPIFGQMGESMFSIYRAIQQQSGEPVIRLGKNDVDFINHNLPYLLESITFYDKKQPPGDPKIVYLHAASKTFKQNTGIPIPSDNASFPDRSFYIQHLYKTLADEGKAKPDLSDRLEF